jgi:hypothetical protein
MKKEGSHSITLGRIHKRICENYLKENTATMIILTTLQLTPIASSSAAPTTLSPSTIAVPQTSTNRLGKMKELQRPSVLLDIVTTCKQFYYLVPNPSDIFAIIHK